MTTPEGGRGLLRATRLGALGWAALLGACLVCAGAASWLAAVAGGVPLMALLAGGLAPVVVLFVLDRAKAAQQPETYVVPGDAALAAVLRGELAQRRLDATVTPAEPGVAGEDGAPGPRLEVACRRGDARQVDAVLAHHGVRLPGIGPR